MSLWNRCEDCCTKAITSDNVHDRMDELRCHKVNYLYMCGSNYSGACGGCRLRPLKEIKASKPIAYSITIASLMSIDDLRRIYLGLHHASIADGNHGKKGGKSFPCA